MRKHLVASGPVNDYQILKSLRCQWMMSLLFSCTGSEPEINCLGSMEVGCALQP